MYDKPRTQIRQRHVIQEQSKHRQQHDLNTLYTLNKTPVERISMKAVRSLARRRTHNANRKSGSSKLFGRSGPTHTPYHMMVESRPLYLLLCLIGAPLRLQRRYHADPLLNYAAIVVYIGGLTTNQKIASSFG